MNVKSRLLEFVSYTQLSRRKFQEKIGVSNSYIQNISESIGADILNRISIQYPELNTDWLLTGNGEMINHNRISVNSNNGFNIEGKSIPLLPVSAQGGRLNDFIVSVRESECEKVVSPIKDADFAIPVSGDSMAPEYPNGSQVHVKKINEKAFIEWGRVYVLDTCNGAVIKRIVPSEKNGYVKCLSINPNPIYAPFEVCLEDVYGIYRVMLCLSIK